MKKNICMLIIATQLQASESDAKYHGMPNTPNNKLFLAVSEKLAKSLNYCKKNLEKESAKESYSSVYARKEAEKDCAAMVASRTVNPPGYIYYDAVFGFLYVANNPDLSGSISVGYVKTLAKHFRQKDLERRN